MKIKITKNDKHSSVLTFNQIKLYHGIYVPVKFPKSRILIGDSMNLFIGETDIQPLNDAIWMDRTFRKVSETINIEITSD